MSASIADAGPKPGLPDVPSDFEKWVEGKVPPGKSVPLLSLARIAYTAHPKWDADRAEAWLLKLGRRPESGFANWYSVLTVYGDELPGGSQTMFANITRSVKTKSRTPTASELSEAVAKAAKENVAMMRAGAGAQ